MGGVGGVLLRVSGPEPLSKGTGMSTTQNWVNNVSLLIPLGGVRPEGVPSTEGPQAMGPTRANGSPWTSGWKGSSWVAGGGSASPSLGLSGSLLLSVDARARPQKEWQKVKKITGNIGFGFSGEEEGRLVGMEEGWPRGEASAWPAPGQLPC